jgi:hypothetical protein
VDRHLKKLLINLFVLVWFGALLVFGMLHPDRIRHLPRVDPSTGVHLKPGTFERVFFFAAISAVLCLSLWLTAEAWEQWRRQRARMKMGDAGSSEHRRRV